MVSTTARQARSLQDSPKKLILCNLRKRRPLRHSNLYRRFEFLSLRHAVCVVEKAGQIPLRGNRRDFAILLPETGPEKVARCAPQAAEEAVFSWRAVAQSGFERLHQAKGNAITRPMIRRMRLDFASTGNLSQETIASGLPVIRQKAALSRNLLAARIGLVLKLIQNQLAEQGVSADYLMEGTVLAQAP